MDRQQLKTMAKAQIKGNIGILFGISLVVSLIFAAVNMIPAVGTLAGTFLIYPAFLFAEIAIMLNLAKGIRPTFRDAFQGFDHFWITFKTYFLTSLFSALWSLLLIVPGIVKSLSYSQAFYIIAEDPEIPALEAISRSKKMMEGHKMELFLLSLSFIGWNLLAICTLGILYIWLLPYMEATATNFYLSIRGDTPEADYDPVDEIPAAAFDPVDEIPAEEEF